MKILLLRQLRAFKKGIFLNVSVFFITLFGIFLFSGLNAVGRDIKQGIDEFYSSQSLADYTVTRSLSSDQLGAVRAELQADGAVSLDAVTLKVGEINRNVILSLYPSVDFQVNIPSVVDGEIPDQSFEALVDDAFAKANGIAPGDVFTVKIEGQPQDITISGLAIFPDHLYKGSEIPQIKETGIIKVLVDLPIQVDTLYIRSELQIDELRAKLNGITGQNFALARILTKTENVSVARIQTDIELINSLVSILPLVCLVALCLILYVNTSKRIEDESYDIGVLSANGISKGKIFVASVLPYFIWVMLAGGIGAALGIIFLPKIYLSILTSFYTLPPLKSAGLFAPLFVPLFVLAAVTLASLTVAIFGALTRTPSTLMRGKAKKSVKILAKSKLPVIYKLSLRNFISYKKKTIITVISATLCLGLLLTAFMLDNSVSNLQDTVYGKYYNYDTTISWNAGDRISYDDVKAAVVGSGYFDDVRFCLEFPATDVDSDKNVMVSIIDLEQPCYDFFDDNGKINLSDQGVYLPSSYGRMDSIALKVYASEPFTLELPVAGYYTDIGVFGVIAPLQAIQRNAPLAHYYLTQNLGQINCVYATKKQGVSEQQIGEFLTKIEHDFSAAFLYERHDVSSEKFTQLLSVLNITEALLFVVCGVIMALLIVNIACLSISDRVKDYTVFKAMGVGDKKINLIGSLENYLSIIVASLLSIPTGMVITNAIIKVVTQITGVVVYMRLYALSVIILLLGAILVTAVSNAFINKKISNVNIANTLKIKE